MGDITVALFIISMQSMVVTIFCFTARVRNKHGARDLLCLSRLCIFSTVALFFRLLSVSLEMPAGPTAVNTSDIPQFLV